MRSSGVGAPCTRMKKVVLPYMIIRSPGFTTPTLIASLSASTAPTATGVPAASPVARAALLVTVPATSSHQPRLGSIDTGATCSAYRSSHWPVRGSYSGIVWLAVCRSMRCSPHNRHTR
jgi:hypothetical protein